MYPADSTSNVIIASWHINILVIKISVDSLWLNEFNTKTYI